MKRKKKLYLNTISAFLLQIVTFICGFILPKQILLCYGSEINGFITSISQFLSVISFLELGISPVIKSNLYKPLSENNNEMISKILISAEKFYRKIAYIFLGYILLLIIVYPLFNKEFDFIFTCSMIIIIAISIFIQYYFGMTYQVFLNADQKIYISSILQIFTIILNTILCIILMQFNFSIHMVKLISSIVFIIRPILQNLYVKKKYKIDFKIKYEEEPIKQKWNGFAQHIASIVNSRIDIILLTFFVGFQSISIYSVYFLVVYGITLIVTTSTSGLESYWGNILVKKEKQLLDKSFNLVEFFTHGVITFLYTSTAILIVPFVSVYISGTNDEELYYLPTFGVLLTFAYAVQCLRLPYSIIIKAAGHYKETQNGSFITIIINIIISLFFIKKFGLIGVASGTLAAMIYHTIYFALYLHNNILKISFIRFLNYIFIDFLSIIIIFYFSQFFNMNLKTYSSWIIYAIKISLVSLSCVSLIFGITYYLNNKLLLKNTVQKYD